MPVDFLMPGMEGGSEIVEGLRNAQFDPGYYRPWIGDDGRKYVALLNGKKDEKGRPQRETVLVSDVIHNGFISSIYNGTSLRKDSWTMLDRAVQTETRLRLRAWSDLMAANPITGIDGMSNIMWEHEQMSDPGEAIQDMDGLTEGRQDRPLFKLQGIPLPITHKDFYFSQRQINASARSGTRLDTTNAEIAGRRVAELVERTVIGTVTGMTYGVASEYERAPTVYGYTNFPSRTTKTDMTAPTGSNGETVLSDWLTCLDLLYAQGFYGPFMVYVSTPWERYLDGEFKSNSDKSLRTRLLEIENIRGIRRLDYLSSGYQVVFVQMTRDVAAAIEGLGITTMMWESQGGLRKNFKVMSIQVPLLRDTYDGNCGILHGTTS